MKLPTLSPFGKLKKTLATSDAVTAEIARHDEHLAATRAALDALEAERAAALLDATDAELDAIDARGREASIALDRLQARRGALALQHVEILQAEAGAALDQRRVEAESRAIAARKWLDGRYAALAREMVDGLTKVREAEADIAAVNNALAATGRHQDAVGPVESLHGMEGVPGRQTLVPLPSIAKLTRLVPIEGKAPGWGHVPYDEVWAGSVGLA